MAELAVILKLAKVLQEKELFRMSFEALISLTIFVSAHFVDMFK